MRRQSGLQLLQDTIQACQANLIAPSTGEREQYCQYDNVFYYEPRLYITAWQPDERHDSLIQVIDAKRIKGTNNHGFFEDEQSLFSVEFSVSKSPVASAQIEDIDTIYQTYLKDFQLSNPFPNPSILTPMSKCHRAKTFGVAIKFPPLPEGYHEITITEHWSLLNYFSFRHVIKVPIYVDHNVKKGAYSLHKDRMSAPRYDIYGANDRDWYGNLKQTNPAKRVTLEMRNTNRLVSVYEPDPLQLDKEFSQLGRDSLIIPTLGASPAIDISHRVICLLAPIDDEEFQNKFSAFLESCKLNDSLINSLNGKGETTVFGELTTLLQQDTTDLVKSLDRFDKEVLAGLLGLDNSGFSRKTRGQGALDIDAPTVKEFFEKTPTWMVG